MHQGRNIEAWRSLTTAPSERAAPFVVTTPEEPWGYAALSDPVRAADGAVVSVRLRTDRGRIGVSLSRPDGSALLSEEAPVAEGEGLRDVRFKLLDHYGPARVLLRSYDAPFSTGELLEASVGPAAGEDALGEAAPLPLDLWLPISPGNIASRDEVLQPVSLGETCEAKVQIARALHYGRWADTSDAAFRLRLAPPARSGDVYGWDLFDWQQTPFSALRSWFDRDFHGVFEREDLVTDGVEVRHRSLLTEHTHDFVLLKPKHEPITDAVVDKGYDAARAALERRAEAFRERLLDPGPFLYILVREAVPTEREMRELIRRLGSRSPEHRFHVLVLGCEDEDSDLSALSEQVTKAYRPRPVVGSGAMEWRGDYRAWDDALAPFRLRWPQPSAFAAGDA